MTNGQLWKKVKDSLIDSNIISGNENEEITVTYVNKTGYSSSVSAYGNNNDDFSSTPSNFSKLKEIDLKKIMYRQMILILLLVVKIVGKHLHLN